MALRCVGARSLAAQLWAASHPSLLSPASYISSISLCGVQSASFGTRAQSPRGGGGKGRKPKSTSGGSKSPPKRSSASSARASSNGGGRSRPASPSRSASGSPARSRSRDDRPLSRSASPSPPSSSFRARPAASSSSVSSKTSSTVGGSTTSGSSRLRRIAAATTASAQRVTLARLPSAFPRGAPVLKEEVKEAKKDIASAKGKKSAASAAATPRKQPEFRSRGVVALVGRPNVGKSTLFNRLVGRRTALVDPTPGTTRDRRSGKGYIAGLEFDVIDTPGLDDVDESADADNQHLQASMTAQTLAAVHAADVVIFMVDVRTGRTPHDDKFARWLRREMGKRRKQLIELEAAGAGADKTSAAEQGSVAATPSESAATSSSNLRSANARVPAVVVVCNKGEGSKTTEADALDFVPLGFSSNGAAPLLMSAEHNEGLDDLFQFLNNALPPLPVSASASASASAPARGNSAQAASATDSADAGANTDSVAVAPIVDLDRIPDASELAAAASSLSSSPSSTSADSAISSTASAPSTKVTPYSGKKGAAAAAASIDPELRAMVEAAALESVDASIAATAPPVTLAIVGRPNVGKSTLINALLNDSSRLVVSPRAHTTRDSITIDFKHEGRAMKLIDTAGLVGTSGLARRKLSKLDGLAFDDAMRSLQTANVCALVLDIEPNIPESTIVELLTNLRDGASAAAQLNRPDYLSRLANLIFEATDISIASKIVAEGRALVLLINKLDRLPARVHRDVLDGLELVVKHVLPSVRGVPIVPISALTGNNLKAIIPTVLAQFDRWNSLIPTYKLNNWLREVTRLRPPPRINGRITRLRFIKQTHARPPHFGLFFSTTPDSLPDAYVRYLTNRMRADFDLHGAPIRVTVKKTKNPWATGDTQRAQAHAKRVL